MTQPPDPSRSGIPCWICGAADADSHEHAIKLTDLRSALRAPTQQQPLFFHNDLRRNQRIGSFKADRLRFDTPICQECNTTRTQPHDFAWTDVADALRARAPSGSFYVRGNRIFSYDTSRAMRAMHLYFVKLFGCLLQDGNVSFDLASFSNAIMKERAHPNIYLRFGRSDIPVGRSDLGLVRDRIINEAAFASWFLHIGSVGVNVMYALPGQNRQGLVDSWHPRFGNRLCFQFAEQFGGDD